MTAQEVFDHTLQFLRKQGRAAMDGFGICQLRTHNGNCCAIGCQLLDGEYKPDFEELMAHSDISWLPERFDPHLTLLQDMQEAHDDNLAEYGMDEWEDAMRWIAIDHGLEYHTT